jgi:LAS superfamily LD-carboxypeptidase LdcB
MCPHNIVSRIAAPLRASGYLTMSVRKQARFAMEQMKNEALVKVSRMLSWVVLRSIAQQA